MSFPLLFGTADEGMLFGSELFGDVSVRGRDGPFDGQTVPVPDPAHTKEGTGPEPFPPDPFGPSPDSKAPMSMPVPIGLVFPS